MTTDEDFHWQRDDETAAEMENEPKRTELDETQLTLFDDDRQEN